MPVLSHERRTFFLCRDARHENVHELPLAGLGWHAMLEPVANSYRTNEPLHWDRVYNLPGFVYFDHSIHVQKGIGCSACHGRIDEMPFTYQVPSLLMEWCIDCHRHPEREIRPREEVFNIQYQKPTDQAELSRDCTRNTE